MRILGADLPPGPPRPGTRERTLVVLGDDGRVAVVRHPASLAEAASAIVELGAGEPLFVGVDLPVVVPERPTRLRPVDGLVRRRLGHRLTPGGRASLEPTRGGVGGEALVAALAAAGLPCLPYPDRDRRSSGLAEIHPALVLKVLLWEGSAVAGAGRPEALETLFKAFEAPDYHAPEGEAHARAGWAERAAALDLVLRALGPVEGFDLRPARESLVACASERDLRRAASILDACLLAGTARRYMDRPETCVFLGDRQTGYTILPADGFVRRLALRERTGAPAARLFPGRSLRAKLEEAADLRPLDLISIPGRPQKLEAVFGERPLLEFDNLDEMLWWKHCRHLAGPELPTEGLEEMVVSLGAEPAGGEADGQPLRLVRSRHRTLSFRFEPPALWRRSVPPRDGKTYAFRVARAVYATAARE